MAQSDFNKRKEVFLEFVYYLFDSFLIPLVNTNFYVTETNPHKMKVFYFRHDTWRWLTEPSVRGMQNSVFEELTLKDAMSRLENNRRLLGHSNVRLLPKTVGVRSIANLKRRAAIREYTTIANKKVLVRTTLGRSINSALAPAFGILKYENVGFLAKRECKGMLTAAVNQP
jgi:telomerase reverse transcriptase